MKSFEEQNEISSEEKTGLQILDKPSDMLGIVGFGLYLSWFYLTLACSTVDNTTADAEKVSLVFSFLSGEIIISILFFFSASHLDKPKMVESFLVISGICLILPGIAEIVSFGEVFLLGSWFISGLGAVILLSLWGLFLQQLPLRQAYIYPALSALIAIAVLILLILGLKESFAPAAGIVVALSSIGLFILWRNGAKGNNDPLASQNSRPPDVKSLLRTASAMVANSFLIGFSFFVLASVGNIGVKGGMLLAMLAAGIFKVIDSFVGPIYQVSTIVRIIAPVAATCLLLIPFVSEPIHYVLMFVMIFVAITNEIICWSAVSEYMHVHRINPFANMAFGRFGDIVGLMLGFLSASLVFSSSLDAAIEPNIFLSIIVIAFVFLQSFVFKDNYSTLADFYVVEDELTGQENEEVDPVQGEWQKKVVQFAEANKLTPRQTEVLSLLSQRYPMGMIERELVVSIHTVKAHIYTIYQKTGVHSREELIDKIEEFEH